MARKKMTDGELWDRMSGESVKNYEYFCAYRDMRYTPANHPDDIPKLGTNPERSLRRLGKKLNRNFKTLGDLSKRFDWVARCDAYDLYILRIQRDRNEAKIFKMWENHAAVGEQLIKRAMRRLLSLTDDEIAAADVVRMMDIGVKIERLSRGDIRDANDTPPQDNSGDTDEIKQMDVEILINEIRRETQSGDSVIDE